MIIQTDMKPKRISPAPAPATGKCVQMTANAYFHIYLSDQNLIYSAAESVRMWVILTQ